MLYVRVEYNTGAVCFFTMNEFANFVDEVRDGESGERWNVALVEMSQEEYESLPEFAGP